MSVRQREKYGKCHGTLSSSEIKEMEQFVRERNPHLYTLLKEGKKPGAFPRRLSLQDGSKDEAQLIYWLVNGIS